MKNGLHAIDSALRVIEMGQGYENMRPSPPDSAATNVVQVIAWLWDEPMGAPQQKRGHYAQSDCLCSYSGGMRNFCPG